MKLVDAHCHLESESFDNKLDSIIEEAKKASIVKLITSSITPSQWEKSRQIAEKFDVVDFALGVHPWYATPSDLNEIEKLAHAKERGAVAIGEIGLDKKIDNPTMDIQVQIFEKQLKIARDLNLPVIVHCRSAFNELIRSLKKIGLPKAGGIVHSFSGSAELAEELIKYGIGFSIGGILTYKKSSKRIRVMKKIYPHHFLLETDSPDIPPIHSDEGPNVPSNILLNLRAAAQLLGEDEERVAETTTENAVRVFNLKING